MCADSASKQGQRITAAAAPKELSRGTAAGGGGGGGAELLSKVEGRVTGNVRVDWVSCQVLHGEQLAF